MFAYHADLLKNDKNETKSKLYKYNYISHNKQNGGKHILFIKY